MITLDALLEKLKLASGIYFAKQTIPLYQHSVPLARALDSMMKTVQHLRLSSAEFMLHRHPSQKYHSSRWWTFMKKQVKLGKLPATSAALKQAILRARYQAIKLYGTMTLLLTLTFPLLRDMGGHLRSMDGRLS